MIRKWRKSKRRCIDGQLAVGFGMAFDLLSKAVVLRNNMLKRILEIGSFPGMHGRTDDILLRDTRPLITDGGKY